MKADLYYLGVDSTTANPNFDIDIDGIAISMYTTLEDLTNPHISDKEMFEPFINRVSSAEYYKDTAYLVASFESDSLSEIRSWLIDYLQNLPPELLI